ncbi:hypothetical protein M409DRAFT_27089 [Zasmidium cellare ATCC 36951]|uniref:Cytochrome b-c1 complex subunit 8 n=1 Tax=Zasmidium cellare ATCC 36951 TaxID=1080233 RepID=A0A6A6C620_ZASCE|nr:uncharacterized protein M409DRAFT_27089 [Zasmidium cellare ATCC 36951]KAF2162465.1 hypothetical protein M409DRAFT_27089 [Zasmidium cellare ATCC 36951]
MEYNQDLRKDHKPVLCWGHKHLPQQYNITTYKLSPNHIRPSYHTFDGKGPFNTF